MKAHAALLYIFNLGYRVLPDGSVMNPSGTVRVLKATRSGYKVINTRARNHPKYGMWSITVPVHRLAAYQLFGNSIFDTSLHVCHIDGNPHNNAHNNLRLGTPSSNRMDIPGDKRVILARNAARHNTHITDDMAAEIRAANLTLREIMSQYGMSKTGASYLRSGRTFKKRADAV